MNVIDTLFQLSDAIMTYIPKVIEFFQRPIEFGFGSLFSSGIIPLISEKLLNAIGIQVDFSMPLISFIVGPGLLFFLGFTVIKWLTDLIL